MENSPSNEDPEHTPLSSKEELINSTKVVSTPTRAKRQTHIRSDSGIKVTKVTLNETLEKVIFELSDELQKDGEYYFQVRFLGKTELMCVVGSEVLEPLEKLLIKTSEFKLKSQEKF